MIKPNKPKILELASLIRGWDVPVDREEITVVQLSSVELANFFFLLVAICHQTSPKRSRKLEGVVEGKRYFGWDFLLQKFRVAATDDRSLLCPETWTRMSEGELVQIFWDEEVGGLLTRTSERTCLINDLGKRMLQRGWETVSEMHSSCNGWISDSDPNLLGELSEFSAYRDPVRKKSHYFLALMKNNGIWNYKDIENLGAPVDYHEVRGHLRIGTIEIQDKQLLKKIRNHETVLPDEDIQIRQAVFDVISEVSNLTGFTSSQLHYLFWNMFRTYCTRKTPSCYFKPANPLPDRYATLVNPKESKKHECPFVTVCSSSDLENRLNEHVFDTDFY